MFSMLPIHPAVVPVSCSLFSPRMSRRPLFINSLLSFYAPIPLKTYNFSIKIRSYVAETHVYIKSLASRLR